MSTVKNYVRDFGSNVIQRVGYQLAYILARRPKFALYSSLGVVIITIICIIAIQPNPSVDAAPDHINNKYFTTIMVGYGDTLWDISKEYITFEYASMDDYMEEVERINHISKDDITAGTYITIPYYAESPRVSQ